MHDDLNSPDLGGTLGRVSDMLVGAIQPEGPSSGKRDAQREANRVGARSPDLFIDQPHKRSIVICVGGVPKRARRSQDERSERTAPLGGRSSTASSGGKISTQSMMLASVWCVVGATLPPGRTRERWRPTTGTRLATRFYPKGYGGSFRRSRLEEAHARRTGF